MIQSDLIAWLPSFVVCPLTTTLQDDADLIRIELEPSAANSLRQRSQIAVDKVTAVPVEKIGAVIGFAEEPLMLRVTRALAVLLGIA